MSDLYKIVSELCERRGISSYRMCKDLGIQPSVMTDLKMGRKKGVNAETANKIASYFGVSVAYLLGIETKEKSPAQNEQGGITFDDFTYALHGETKELNDENRAKLLEMARFFKEQQKKGK